MTLLLDSQALLWAIYDISKLTPLAADLISDRSNRLLVSDASLWEISLKLAKRKLAYEASQASLRVRISELETESLSITQEHILRAVTLPPHHLIRSIACS